MLLKSLTFLLTCLILEIRGEQGCDNPLPPEKIDPTFWNGNPVKAIIGNCTKSYFKIDILKEQSLDIVQILGGGDDLPHLDYELDIYDSSNTDSSLVKLTNRVIKEEINIASQSNYVIIKVKANTNTVNFPHIIQYQEIPRKNIIETANQNNTIKYDDIEPNSVAEYIMDGHGDVQFFDVSWNFQNNLGYLALENGNGRITLMSIPNMNEFKVAMKKPEEMIKWRLVTDKRPNENPHKKSSFRLEHSLGPLVEPTTTTAPNTTTPRPSTGELRIFILAINETGFYSQKFNQFYKEIQEKANEQGACKITRTYIESCRLECGMTSNPERGCLAFNITLEKSILCNYTITSLKNDLKKELKLWAHKYDAWRINLDDCLTSVQYQWIIFAVLIPIGSMAFVITAYFLMKSWIKKVRQIKLERRLALEEQRESLKRMSTGGGKHKKYMTRTISQFEILEVEE